MVKNSFVFSGNERRMILEGVDMLGFYGDYRSEDDTRASTGIMLWGDYSALEEAEVDDDADVYGVMCLTSDDD